MGLMRNGKDERVKGTAAQALLDRGWGKPRVEVVTNEHPSGTLGLSHLLIAADAELALTEIVALFNGLASPSFRVPLASLV